MDDGPVRTVALEAIVPLEVALLVLVLHLTQPYIYHYPEPRPLPDGLEIPLAGRLLSVLESRELLLLVRTGDELLKLLFGAGDSLASQPRPQYVRDRGSQRVERGRVRRGQKAVEKVVQEGVEQSERLEGEEGAVGRDRRRVVAIAILLSDLGGMVVGDYLRGCGDGDIGWRRIYRRRYMQSRD